MINSKEKWTNNRKPSYRKIHCRCVYANPWNRWHEVIPKDVYLSSLTSSLNVNVNVNEQRVEMFPWVRRWPWCLFETYTKLVSLAYVVEMGSGAPGPSVVLVQDELEVEGMLRSNVPTLPILSSGPGDMQGFADNPRRGGLQLWFSHEASWLITLSFHYTPVPLWPPSFLGVKPWELHPKWRPRRTEFLADLLLSPRLSALILPW